MIYGNMELNLNIAGEKITVLVIDDDATSLRHMQLVLQENGYFVAPARSGERALKYLDRHCPDVILLDIEMPEMDGYDVMARLNADKRWRDIPVIFLTGREGAESELRALEMGAVDYIQKPVIDTLLLARLKMHMELESYRKGLSKLVEQKTRALEQKNLVLRNMQEIVIAMLAHLTEYRDEETGGHIIRTKEYVSLLLSGMSCVMPGFRAESEYVANVGWASQLHDVGKVAVPDAILLKPGKLDRDEWEVMKTHPERGANILSDAAQALGVRSLLDTGREIALSHHEWWDGAGYPHGLSGEDIPFTARVTAIADVYDALRSLRPYKQPFSHEEACTLINQESGTHFDPVLVEVFNWVHNDFDVVFRAVQ